MTARERHVKEIDNTWSQLKALKKKYRNTPHMRDMERRLHRLQKELRIYDFYMANKE